MGKLYLDCKACNRHSELIEQAVNFRNNCPHCGTVIPNAQVEALYDNDALFSIIESLDQDQLKAALTTEGIVRVIAGPGSGKTKLLTSRLAYILLNRLAPAPRILALTFTRKASDEMKNRLRLLLPSSTDTVPVIDTFHGFCFKFLKDAIFHTTGKVFTLMDVADQKSLLGDIYDDLGINGKRNPQDEVLLGLSQFKIEGYSHYVPLLLSSESTGIDQRVEQAMNEQEAIYWSMIRLQWKFGRLDFNDLECITAYLLETNQHLREYLNCKYMYVSVDESQDINHIEFYILQQLALSFDNLFLVGDPDQNIYSWRGSDVSHLINLASYYPHMTTITLNTNYRSIPAIVDVSERLIKHNILRLEKNAISARQNEGAVYVHHAIDSKDEANFVVREIKNNLSPNISLADIAILFRSGREVKMMETALRAAMIPYVLSQGLSFFSRHEIKTIFRYLSFLALGDDFSFERIINTPTRGVGDKRLSCLYAFAEANKVSLWSALHANLDNPQFATIHAVKDFVRMIDEIRKDMVSKKVSDLVKSIFQQSGLEESYIKKGMRSELKAMHDFLQLLMDNERRENLPLKDFLENFVLYEAAESPQKAVRLSTIHAVKGMEFKMVFVCGVSESILPSSRSRTNEELEEERRLAYVAFTRAIDRLYITRANFVQTAQQSLPPSRFIAELEASPYLHISKGVPPRNQYYYFQKSMAHSYM